MYGFSANSGGSLNWLKNLVSLTCKIKFNIQYYLEAILPLFFICYIFGTFLYFFDIKAYVITAASALDEEAVGSCNEESCHTEVRWAW